jgi:hypothetical protein
MEGIWGKSRKREMSSYGQLCVLQQTFGTCTGHTLGFDFFNIFLHPSILQTQEAKSVNVVAEEIGEPV